MSEDQPTTAAAAATTAAPAATATDAPASEPIQLGLNDLQACIQIIDIASTRGAFRGEELAAIGGARDRIAAFLDANKPPEAAAAADAQPSDADAE